MWPACTACTPSCPCRCLRILMSGSRTFSRMPLSSRSWSPGERTNFGVWRWYKIRIQLLSARLFLSKGKLWRGLHYCNFGPKWPESKIFGEVVTAVVFWCNGEGKEKANLLASITCPPGRTQNPEVSHQKAHWWTPLQPTLFWPSCSKESANMMTLFEKLNILRSCQQRFILPSWLTYTRTVRCGESWVSSKDPGRGVHLFRQSCVGCFSAKQVKLEDFFFQAWIISFYLGVPRCMDTKV